MKTFLLVLAICSLVSAQATQPSSYRFDLHGLVTDQFGKPIAGAQIDVFTGGQNYEPPRPFAKIAETRADADGKFSMNGCQKPTELSPHIIRAVAPKMGFAYFTGPGFVATTGDLLQMPMRDTGVWLVLHPAGTIRGRVIDERGNPVADAQIIGHLPLDPILTDKLGRFTIEHAPLMVDDDNRYGTSARILTVLHPDFVADRFSSAQYRDNVELKVRGGVLISGQFTDVETREPVPDGAVTVQYQSDGKSPYYPRFYARCDEEGWYRLRVPQSLGTIDLLPQVSTVAPTARRYQPTEARHIVKLESADRFDEYFTCARLPDAPAATTQPRPRRALINPLPKLSGRVVNERGSPVTLARVEVIDLGSKWETLPRRPIANKEIRAKTNADQDGKFEVSIDTAQPLLVWSWDPAGQRMGQLITEGGTTAVEVRLAERSSRLAGVVRDSVDQPREGIPVSLAVMRNPVLGNVEIPILFGVTDANGRYELAGFHELPQGMTARIRVESGPLEWFDGPSQRIGRSSKAYQRFPVEPGQTLDGLDFEIQTRPGHDEPVALPVREEFTREPD